MNPPISQNHRRTAILGRPVQLALVALALVASMLMMGPSADATPTAPDFAVQINDPAPCEYEVTITNDGASTNMPFTVTVNDVGYDLTNGMLTAGAQTYEVAQPYLGMGIEVTIPSVDGSAPVEMDMPLPSTCEPDLHILSADFVAGCAIEFVVENIGGSTSPETYVDVKENGVVIDDVDLDPVPAGEQATLQTAPFVTPGATAELRVFFVALGFGLFDSNTGNNSSDPLTVPPLPCEPDFSVMVSGNPATCQYAVTTVNNGADAPGPVSLSVAGGSQSAMWPGVFAQGDQQVLLVDQPLGSDLIYGPNGLFIVFDVIHAGNSVYEGFASVMTGCMEDIALTADLTTGCEVSVTAENVGFGDSEATEVTVDDGTTQSSIAIPALAAGSPQVVLTQTFAPGANVTVSVPDVVFDADSGNNSTGVQVPQNCDVSDIEVTVEEAGPCAYEIVVTNNGGVAAETDLLVNLDGEGFASLANGLAANASVSVGILTTPFDTATINVEVQDTASQLSSVTAPVDPACLPNLGFASVDEIDCAIRMTIVNSGGDPSGATTLTDITTGTVLETIPALNANGQVELAISGLAPGTVVELMIDPLPNESVTSDNSWSPVTIPANCVPDLAITDVVNVFPCGVGFTVTNVGGYVSDPTTATFPVVGGSASSQDPTALTEVVPALQPGESVWIPELNLGGLVGGDSLHVHIDDPLNSELNLANNTSDYPLTLTENCSSIADLSLSLVPNASDPCAFELVVTNLGHETLDDIIIEFPGTDVLLTVQSGLMGNESTDPIDPQPFPTASVFAAEVLAVTTQGLSSFPDNDLMLYDETQLTNNIVYEQFPSGCMPDLAFVNVAVVDCSVQYQIKNFGGSLSPQTEIGAWVNIAWDQTFSQQVPMLSPGQTSSVFTAPFDGGDSVTLSFDLPTDSDPSNDSTGELEFIAECDTTPELEVSAVSDVSSCTYTIVVSNSGDSTSTSIDLTVDNVVVATYAGLAQNGTETYVVPQSLAGATISVDVTELANETNWQDNSAVVPIPANCAALPDLAIDVAATASDPCRFDVAVTNNGPDTTDDIIASLGWQLSTIVGGLESNESAIVFTVEAPFGSNSATAQVPALPGEVALADNAVTLDIPDSCLADLIVDDIVVNTCSIYYVIKNVGTAAMGTTAKAKISDSDGRFLLHTISDLAPGDSWTSPNIVVPTQSQGTIYFAADSKFEIAESDEGTQQVVNEVITGGSCKMSGNTTNPASSDSDSSAQNDGTQSDDTESDDTQRDDTQSGETAPADSRPVESKPTKTKPVPVSEEEADGRRGSRTVQPKRGN